METARNRMLKPHEAVTRDPLEDLEQPRKRRGRPPKNRPPEPKAEPKPEGVDRGHECPYCGSRNSKVDQTWHSKAVDPPQTRRRRFCQACNRYFWTIETLSDI